MGWPWPLCFLTVSRRRAMKLGATRKIRSASAKPATDQARSTGWMDEIQGRCGYLQANLAGLGLNHDQSDRLLQEVASQLRHRRAIRPASAEELYGSVDAFRLSGKVGVPLNVVRSALEMLAQRLASER